MENNQKISQLRQKRKIICLEAPPSSITPCKEIGLDIKPLKLRLIRIELKTGKTEILITSLTDEKLFPIDIFENLYHLQTSGNSVKLQ